MIVLLKVRGEGLNEWYEKDLILLIVVAIAHAAQAAVRFYVIILILHRNP
jgi:hypothetical protein